MKIIKFFRNNILDYKKSLDDFKTNELWRNFTENEIREKSKKQRKLSIERWKMIEEAVNITNGFQRRPIAKIQAMSN